MGKPTIAPRDVEKYEDFLKRFTQIRERLLAYIYSPVPRLADAEDIFQKCILVQWRQFDNFDQDRNFLVWACGVAFYEVRNYLRTIGRSVCISMTNWSANLRPTEQKH